MANLLDHLGGAWEYITKGNMSQVIISCSEDDYDFAMKFKKDLHDQSDEVNVRLVVGETLTLDEDTEIKLEKGVVALSFIHDGNFFARPSMETHTMTFEMEKE